MLNKKNLVVACLAATLVTWSGAANAAPAFPEGSSMDRIVKAKKVRIGTKFDQPGTAQKNLKGELIGFDIDIAKLIVAKLGLKPEDIEWTETTALNREPFIEHGKVDFIVGSYAMTEKRKEVVSFVGPYLIDGHTVVIKDGNPLKLHGPKDLAGRKICTLAGGGVLPTITKYAPEAKLITFDAHSKCFEALKNGSVDGIAIAGSIAVGFMIKDPNTMEFMDKPYVEEKFGIGLKKGDVQFCNFIRDALTDSAKKGVYQASYDKHLAPFTKQKPELPAFESCQ